MSDRICTNCGGSTATGCRVCNPDIHQQYLDSVIESGSTEYLLKKRIAELEEVGRGILELAWRDHRSDDEQALLIRADQLLRGDEDE